MLKYCIDRIRVIGTDAFSEASKEELRVLLALIQLSGEVESPESLASAAMISPPRCKAAIAFWEESGVISQIGEGGSITDEFEERLVAGEIDEVPAVEVAESIRNEGLALMINDVAELMGQACLSNVEVKTLTALYTQYALSPEYIVALAAHLKSKGCLTVKRLSDKAITLVRRGVDSYEGLEAHLSEIESSSGAEWEFRRLFGIYNATLSQSQREYFRKWSEDYGYSVGIVSLAYDIAVLNTRSGRGDLRYIDAILTEWHNAGCKTVNECREYIEAERAKKAAKTPIRTGKKATKSTPETPRYGNFDINEAFNDAVARSFSEDNGDEGGDQ